ncbi:HD domain-containing phosphohydrolase [Marinobacter sp. 1Y8]
MKRRPARFSLALLIALAITTGMITLTSILVFQGYRGMESAKLAATAQSVDELVMSVNDRIKTLTDPPITSLLLLRDSALLHADTLAERTRRLPVLADILRINTIVDAAYIGYPTGEFFLLRRLESRQKSLFSAPISSRFMLQTTTRKENAGLVAELRFYDDHLRLLEARQNPDNTYDPRTRGWYTSASLTDDITLTTPYMFFTTREVGITLAQRGNNTPAIVGLDVTVSALNNQLETLKFTPSTEIAIINSANQILAYPGSDHITYTIDKTPALATLKALGDTPLQNVEAMKTDAHARYFQAADQEWYGTSASLTSAYANGLKVLIAIPADELLSDVWAVLKQQIAIGGFVVLLLIAIGWQIGKRLGASLQELTGQVRALSWFRFDTPIGVESNIREAQKLGTALNNMTSTVRSFKAISLTLNRGQDLDVLLRDILHELISIVGQQQGAVYLYSFKSRAMELAASEGVDHLTKLENVVEADSDEDIIRRFRKIGSDHAVYTVLRNRSNQLVGALMIDLDERQFARLDNNLIQFVSEIGGSAAVAIETRQLIESQKAMLNGVIKLIADAIDAKSPYTSGHCERVPRLAQMIVAQAEQSNQPPFADFSMSEDEHYEFNLAAWLHDCGKITSPEYVVDKATKLETIYNRIHEIRTRFEVLHRDIEIACLQQQLEGADPEAAIAARDRAQQQLQDDFAFLAEANVGGEFMSDEAIERINGIGDRTWQRYFSNRLGLSQDEQSRIEGNQGPALPATEQLLSDKPEHVIPWGTRKPPVTADDPDNRWGFDMDLPDQAYNYGERYNLGIRRGTLTPEERFKINDHIVQTIIMLEALPLPQRLSNVPRLAGSHHEKMDGTGYPRRLPGEVLSVPEKAMMIADIFEALTAIDRPYKEGKTVSQALGILSAMAKGGHIDIETYNLFLTSGIPVDYARKFLREDQIDDFDVGAFLVDSH